MYLQYYQLQTKPFQITSDPSFLWLGEKHKEALATLRYGIVDNRGFLLLTGEVGTGKTILINRLISMLDIDTVVATLPDPDLVSMDLYNLLADGFKMNRTFDSKAAFLIHLRDFLHQSYADRKQVLLIIDESQRLNHHLMEDIRVLSNIELHDRKLINIFFVGQPEFNNILMTPQNRALAQRITVRYHIEPLDQTETSDYIQHRLKLAGSKQQLFKRKALEEIFQFSSGIPRLINIICDHALLTGFSRGSKEIDEIIIRECAQELRIPVHQPVFEIDSTSGDRFTSAAGPGDADRANTTKSSDADTRKNHRVDPPRPSIWKMFYAVIVMAIIAMGAYYLVNRFYRNEGPRWNVDELTPQKYKTTLEKEKALLASRLESGSIDENSAPASEKGLMADSDRQTGVAGDQQADLAKNEQITEAPARPANAGSNGVGVSAMDSEIEPLPLIKEKVMIHFSNNSNEIDDGSYAMLDRIAAYLSKQPGEIIHVRGYTDASGTPGYNASVSRFRASAVKSYLIGKGAPANSIRTFAMGAVNPLASNDSAQGRGANRRVEIEFPDNRVSGQNDSR